MNPIIVDIPDTSDITDTPDIPDTPDFPEPFDGDYSALCINEISGEHKYVEIYNSGGKEIPLEGVKLLRNGGSEEGSQWAGTEPDFIPAGAYGLITFDDYNLPDEWTDEPVILGSISSEISDQQKLKIALVDPLENLIDLFIRGDSALPPWGETVPGCEHSYSYSLMADNTWAYAAPTPGAANSAKEKDIENPGYLTSPGIDLPLISGFERDPVMVFPDDEVTVFVTVKTKISAIINVVLYWMLDGAQQDELEMAATGDIYSALIPAEPAGSAVSYWVSSVNDLGEASVTAVQNYTVLSNPADNSPPDYSKLVLNEISGEHKFAEIFNSGKDDIPLEGVRLQRNDGPAGGSEWVGTESDFIPAGAYRLFLFNNYNPVDLAENPAYTGWTISSGISDQQILKAALLDPAGNPIDVFIRGENPLPPWQETEGVTRNRQQSYSRMPGGSWAYANPTPGEENGPKIGDIVKPGYLTSQPVDPPIIANFSRTPADVSPSDSVKVSALVTTSESAIDAVILEWTLNETAQAGINMVLSESVYSAVIPAQVTGSMVTYRVSASNDSGEITVTSFRNYTVGVPPVDYSKLKLNEVSGAGNDSQKFYELINTGTADIPLEGCQIFYNANASAGGVFPPNGNQGLTWTGNESQTIMAGQLFSLIGRNTPGSFTTGLTAARILIITLKDPDGNVIDECIRAADLGIYNFTNKSFSRIPDGSGPFFFTEPTPDAINPASSAGLTQVPDSAPSVTFVTNPVFSSGSGLYGTEFSLTLTAPGCDIYYSTDGSIPLASKAGNGYVFKYSNPIEIRDRTGEPNVLASSQNILQMYAQSSDLWPGYKPGNYVPSAIQVPKATVIRAQAVDSLGGISDVITKTYFIVSGLNGFENHRIVSLVSDPENLVSESTGILVRGPKGRKWIDTGPGIDTSNAYNFQQKGRDWEREVYLELFEGNENYRSVPLSTGAGIRVRGGYSRGMAQKSFSVYFREEYGINTLQNYQLIPGAVKADGITPVERYKNFALRNGGNDAEYTKFYDVFAQDLLRDRSFTVQAAVPCIVFINGEYWGPYNLQEKYSDNHTEYKYGVAKENVIAYDNDELEEGLPGDLVYYTDMLAAGTKDMSIKANYDAFCEIADIDNFIDYCAAQMYVNNEDWPHNNFRTWRTRTVEPGNPYGDTKWRWEMFDLDCIFGVNSDGQTTGEDKKDVFNRILNGSDKGNDVNLLIKSLLKNAEFCRKLVNNIMDLYNVNFHPDAFNPKYNYYSNVYRTLMTGSPGYFQRWGYQDSKWTDVFDELSVNLLKYMNAIRNDMPNKYLPQYFNGYSGIANIGVTSGGLRTVTLSTNGASGASVKINTVTPDLSGGSWTGQYYTGNPVTVTAIAPAGFAFSGWTVTGGTADDLFAATAVITITGNVNITANFTGL